MSKYFYSLGLMSGTSMDGVDASIIQSDGEAKYKVILDQYFRYNKNIYRNLLKLRDKIKNSKDLKKLSKEVKTLEKQITLFHVDVVNKIKKKRKININLIGFHGQTIFHNAKEKKSEQLGDGELLSKLTKNNVVYNFRQNDLNNGGEGAPLTPVFHRLLVKQNKIKLPVCILNIGGIANATVIKNYNYKEIKSNDLGPGNCLIDAWVRKKTEKKYDKNGLIARSGMVNKKLLKKITKKFKQLKNYKNLSFDIKDFDLSLVSKLTLNNGAATLTNFTGKIINEALLKILKNLSNNALNILVSGGGRKNNYLMKEIKKINLKNKRVQLIDDYGINGDFVESQAFAFLAIRSYLKLPISFPGTTGVKKPCVGGKIIKFKL
jgi:anhydro-N-acetylmuramic acid kinase